MKQKFIEIKGKNYRVLVILDYTDKDNKTFVMQTKRLVDFKTRNIVRVNNIFGFETFAMIYEAMKAIFENETVQNKILINDFHKLNNAPKKPKGTSNLKDW
jgi:hypothetical protein